MATETMLTVKIIPNDSSNPPGKLADAELRFGGAADARDWLTDRATDLPNARAFRPVLDLLTAFSALDGLKLIGFSIWERRSDGHRTVTFPARQYSVNGERRSFALLRPMVDAAAQTRVRDLILEAYAQHEADKAAIA